MSKVKVVSKGKIDNTKIYVDGVEQKNVESIMWEINRTDKVGILTVTFYYLDEETMEYKEQWVSSRDTKAFNDEEDRIEFHLDGDIPGNPMEGQGLTIMEWQAKYNKGDK